MPSPFPGMDPWLEAPGLFPDLHNRFIAYLSEAVNARLPRPYYSAVATRVYVEDSDRQIEPDVNVVRAKERRSSGRGGVAVGGPSAAHPVIVRVPSEQVTEWLLEVRDPDSGDRLVTTVEVLSPANKRSKSKGRRLYLRKRRELHRGRVSTVEIDLLRSGAHTTAVPSARMTRQTGSFDYHLCVHRAHRTEEYEVYPVRLADRLPVVAVPLLRKTPAVDIDLQPVLDRSYDVGLYAGRAKYQTGCVPPLSADQQAWADEILRSKGLKP